MEQKREPGNHYAVKSPSRGGARAGAGRPKGSTNKITMDNLLSSLNNKLGVSYADQIAENYVQALNRSDWSGVRDYDRFLLGKMVADKQEVEVIDSEDAVQAKADAFAEAVATVIGKQNDR